MSRSVALDLASDDDLLTPEEKAEALALFKPATRQDFATKAEQQEYLRLLSEFEEPKSWAPSIGEWIAIGLGTVAVGVVIGWFWRKHREARAREKFILPSHTTVGDDNDDDGLTGLGTE